MPDERSKKPGESTGVTPARDPSSATRPTPLAKGRVTPRSMRSPRPKRRKTNSARTLYIIGGSTIAVLMIIALFLPNLASLRSPTQNKGNDLDPPGQFVPAMANSGHIPNGQIATFASNPPTSGPHYERAAPWGVFDDQARLPDELITHNLEHSGVVVSHNLSDPNSIVDLKNVLVRWPSYPCYVVMRPYDKIPAGTVALSAWTKLDGPFPVAAGRLDDATMGRVTAFLEAYGGNRSRSNAPEFFGCNPQPRDERTPFVVGAAATPTPAPANPTPQAATPTP